VDRWGGPFELTRAIQESLEGTESTPLADNITTSARAAVDVLAGRPLQVEIQRAMDYHFGSLQAVVTRVDALLASTMLR
jgi:hypothetical protein